MMIANRESFAVASRRRLPYDAEVEWVEGSAYVVTGYYPSDRTTFIHSCQTGTSSTVPFCGMPWISEAQNFLCSAANNNQRLYLDYGSGFGYNRIVLGPSNTWWQNRRLRLEAGNRYVRDTISGYSKTAASVSFARKTTSWRVYSYARVFAHQLYDDGALILDLVPVRKDGVAYLYNKVDNRLLPFNSSSVVIGPDKTPWTNPYITNGLVAMWDGEWNAGGGIHDAAATEWKDLIGNHDMEFVTPSAVSVLDNAMQFVASFSQTTGRAMRATAPSSVVMVDMCFSCVSGYTVNQNIFLGPTSSDGFNVLTVIAANRNRGFVCTKGPILGPGESDIGACTIATTGAAGWKNGVALAQGEDNGSGFTNDGYVTLCGGSSQEFKIHSLRLYSRILTTAEIAANCAIDKERFNLP